MNTANGHEVLEEIFPNPEGHLRSTTDAILRIRDGRRFLVSILGGCHKDIPTEFHTVEILGPAPAKTDRDPEAASGMTVPLAAQPVSEDLAAAGV
ncbi:MAG: hypothetical protein PHH13_04430 [Candidatus Peribacteraceae bacterium]|nr:hypothetical protein [Candidatus Peribacteraceae bacterium]